MDIRVATDDDLDVAADMLHAFNSEFGDTTPGPEALAARLRELTDTDVLLAGEVGVAVLRFRQALWTPGLECYLAELYVRPGERGHGIGRALLSTVLRHARTRGADMIYLGTTEDDVAARHLYEALGMRRTEGAAGPLMYLYEKDLA